MLRVTSFGVGIEIIADNSHGPVYYKDSAEKDNNIGNVSFHLRSCRK